VPEKLPPHIHIGSSMHKDWGGIERYIAFLTAELAREGHPVTATAPAGSPLAKHLVVPTHKIRLATKYDPIALASHIRLFKREKPEFIVTHFSPDYIVPALAARIAKVPKNLMTRHVAVNFKGNERSIIIGCMMALFRSRKP